VAAHLILLLCWHLWGVPGGAEKKQTAHHARGMFFGIADSLFAHQMWLFVYYFIPCGLVLHWVPDAAGCAVGIRCITCDHSVVPTCDASCDVQLLQIAASLSYVAQHHLPWSVQQHECECWFFCYQGERNLTGWPHTILSGKPNSREPEVLPHQQNTPHAL
jgi:hypothetical protein